MAECRRSIEIEIAAARSGLELLERLFSAVREGAQQRARADRAEDVLRRIASAYPCLDLCKKAKLSDADYELVLELLIPY